MEHKVTIRITRVSDGQLLRLFSTDQAFANKFILQTMDNLLITVIVVSEYVTSN